MREKPDARLKRITTGPMGSDESYGINGVFTITGPKGKLRIIASNGGGWEHVSVCRVKNDQPPSWEEMVFVKSLFWKDDECVVQYHPPKENYVNNHPNVLHLWRPIESGLPMPPTNMIGIPNFRITQVTRTRNGYIVAGFDE